MIAILAFLRAVPWKIVGIVAVLAVLWFSGYRAGSAHVQHLRDQDALERTAEDNKRLMAEEDKEVRYGIQLRAAASAAMDARDELARLRAAPHPGGIVCERTERAYTTMPGLPTASTDQASLGGILSSTSGFNFNPTQQLYDLADQADSAVETAREALASWPKQ